jgi:hypothetical protein
MKAENLLTEIKEERLQRLNLVRSTKKRKHSETLFRSPEESHKKVTLIDLKCLLNYFCVENMNALVEFLYIAIVS